MLLLSALDGLTLARRRLGTVRLRTRNFKIEQPQQSLLRLVKLYDRCVWRYKGCYKCINRKGQNYDFADSFTFYI